MKFDWLIEFVLPVHCRDVHGLWFPQKNSLIREGLIWFDVPKHGLKSDKKPCALSTFWFESPWWFLIMILMFEYKCTCLTFYVLKKKDPPHTHTHTHTHTPTHARTHARTHAHTHTNNTHTHQKTYHQDRIHTHTHPHQKNIIKISRSLTHPLDCVVDVFFSLKAQQATGYPLAYVAAKLALGHDLVQLRLGDRVIGTTEIQNDNQQKTT